MSQEIIQKLKSWRAKKAKEEDAELFVVLHNKTIEEIAENLPKNEEEFKAIKGLGGKKFEKYGQEILSIVNECSGDQEAKIEKTQETDENGEKFYSVSTFLDIVNSELSNIQVGIRGEISSINFRRHAYFSLKDQEDDSVVNCFMWESDYEICGVELEEGVEVIVRGYPEVYKPSGKLTFRTSTIELVGEGALKKAYDELKKKLASEGLFDESRKKPIPQFPTKIGLITSKNGAVIHDFQTNLGRFGYKITFMDSRVEGVIAVKYLISAMRYFKNKDIEVLVIIRGGGSLESLQSFNNEALIREIVDYPLPILCGIGHDKDVPLFSMVADMAVSTPSMVAREINKSWEQAIDKIRYSESSILNNYLSSISNYRRALDDISYRLNRSYQSIFRRVSSLNQVIGNIFNKFSFALKILNDKVKIPSKNITNNFSDDLLESKQKVTNSLRSMRQNDPNRQLSLGYSIIFSGGKVIKSVKQVSKKDILISKLSDGEIKSQVE